MPDIVLTTLNARYAHASFGLRYLQANLGPLQNRSVLMEFDISQRTTDILEAILSASPRIVGLGVYIWNAGPCLELCQQLKRLRPDIVLVLGGPEVSHETDQQEICRLADFVITGEADLAFAELCAQVLANRRPLIKVIAAAPPEFSSLKLPYDLYTDHDLAHRVAYVEASRGCPFKCEFCLSSLDVPVRNAPLDEFLSQMQGLLDRGLRQFKFVDRTFNLSLPFSRSILQFFLDRYSPGLFLHFEMIPDRLPEALRDLIRRFPPGAMQFEVGVQTFNEAVQARISRRQDNARLADNLTFLRNDTGVHVHADLIVGLPGEDVESFASGFDRLLSLGVQEIQVGILKRLRGAPIARHDAEWGMVYGPVAPYEILESSAMDFAMLQRLRRFARYWDLLANSGNFTKTLPHLWKNESPFWSFLKFVDWLHQHGQRSYGIALQDQARLLFEFLTVELSREPAVVAADVWADYQRGGRSDRPAFLRAVLTDMPVASRRQATGLPSRQARHLPSSSDVR